MKGTSEAEQCEISVVSRGEKGGDGSEAGSEGGGRLGRGAGLGGAWAARMSPPTIGTNMYELLMQHCFGQRIQVDTALIVVSTGFMHIKHAI